MSNTSWLERAALKLRRAGLPAEYIERTIIEFADHAIEMDEHSESTNSDSFVDSCEDLTKLLIRNFRRSRWYRRVPSLAWLIVPLPLSILACFAFHALMLFAMGVTYADLLGAKPNAGIETFLIPWLLYTGKFATPLIACYLLFKVLEKAARPAWVGFCSTVILALWFMATSTAMSLPTASTDGSFNVSIDTDSIGNVDMLGWQICQVILVVGLACVETSRKKTRRSLAADG